MMRLLDEQYTRTPFYGIRRMTAWLRKLRQGGEPQARGPLAATDGAGSHLPEAAVEPARYTAQDISLSAAWPDNPAAEPGLEHRHHLYAVAAGVRLSGGDHGLVQPLCSGLGGVGYAGRGLLRGSAGMGIANSAAGNFQIGPGITIHKRTVHGVAAWPTISGSAWMGAVGRWTTSSWSAYGGR